MVLGGALTFLFKYVLLVLIAKILKFNSCTHLGGAPLYVYHKLSYIVYLLCNLVVLSSITKKGEIESASRPLIMFWMIDVNTIKFGLILLLRMCVDDYLKRYV